MLGINIHPANYVCIYDSDKDFDEDPVYYSFDEPVTSNMDPSYYADDWSYFYISYAVFDDEDVAVFAEYYKQRMNAEKNVVSDIPLLNGVKSFPLVESATGDEKFVVEYDHLFRLGDSLTGLRIHFDESTARENPNAVLQSLIPVLIERPGNHESPGANVVYLDGHAEWKTMGEWPLTEKTIGLLMELDAMEVAQ